MPDQDDELEDDDVWDAGLFDVSRVKFKFLPTKSKNEFIIKFYDENTKGQFPHLKVYLALQKAAEELEKDYYILDGSEMQ
jgi:hypothetical protein